MINSGDVQSPMTDRLLESILAESHETDDLLEKIRQTDPDIDALLEDIIGSTLSPTKASANKNSEKAAIRTFQV